MCTYGKDSGGGGGGKRTPTGGGRRKRRRKRRRRTVPGKIFLHSACALPLHFARRASTHAKTEKGGESLENIPRMDLLATHLSVVSGISFALCPSSKCTQKLISYSPRFHRQALHPCWPLPTQLFPIPPGAFPFSLSLSSLSASRPLGLGRSPLPPSPPRNESESKNLRALRRKAARGRRDRAPARKIGFWTRRKGRKKIAREGSRKKGGNVRVCAAGRKWGCVIKQVEVFLGAPH